MQVVQKLQGTCKVHVDRLGFENTPCPTTKPLENIFYPSPSMIAAKVHKMLYSDRESWSPPISESKEVANFKGPF